MTQQREPAHPRRSVNLRTLGGVLLVVVVAVFIAMNREDTNVSFILFDVQASLWIALTVAAGGGFVAGFLLSRRRHR